MTLWRRVFSQCQVWMEFSSYSYPAWETATSDSVIFTVHFLQVKNVCTDCGCWYDSECSRIFMGRCSRQVVRGISQWTVAPITGNSEETHTVWTTKELRVCKQCWQMMSWVSCGRREGLLQWTSKSTVELWGMRRGGGRSAGYAGHYILHTHPGELGLKPSSWALSSVVGEGGSVRGEGGSIQMGANIEDQLGVRAKSKWEWGPRKKTNRRWRNKVSQREEEFA